MSNIFGKIKSFIVGIIKRSDKYERRAAKPTRDWLVILISSFVIFCALVAVAGYLFTLILGDKLFVTDKNSRIKETQINVSLLKKATTDIDARAASTTDIKSGLIRSFDPSL